MLIFLSQEEDSTLPSTKVLFSLNFANKPSTGNASFSLNTSYFWSQVQIPLPSQISLLPMCVFIFAHLHISFPFCLYYSTYMVSKLCFTLSSIFLWEWVFCLLFFCFVFLEGESVSWRGAEGEGENLKPDVEFNSMTLGSWSEQKLRVRCSID